MPETTYTPKELVRFVILDTIADIRAAEVDGMEGMADFAADQRAFLRRLVKHRHTARVDRYGWPILPPEEVANGDR